MIVTIAICTFNRASYLKKCLDALVPQLANYQDRVHVMVVDNNSDDNTALIVKGYNDKGIVIDYHKEINIGLSYARNRAIKIAKTKFLGYLDDDAIPYDDYLKVLLQIIDDNDPDCFGGMYYPYYENQKPRWISDSFGKKSPLSNVFSKIENRFLSGGNMYAKLEILKELNGFDVTRGMKGDKIGYSEEDDFQKRLREAGYQVYFDPSLAMDHLVADYKQKMTWHIKKIYQASLNTVDPVFEKFTLWYSIKSLGRIALYKTPRLMRRFLTDWDYYYQNLIVDIFTSYARVIGLFFNRNK